MHPPSRMGSTFFGAKNGGADNLGEAREGDFSTSLSAAAATMADTTPATAPKTTTKKRPRPATADEPPVAKRTSSCTGVIVDVHDLCAMFYSHWGVDNALMENYLWDASEELVSRSFLLFYNVLMSPDVRHVYFDPSTSYKTPRTPVDLLNTAVRFGTIEELCFLIRFFQKTETPKSYAAGVAEALRIAEERQGAEKLEISREVGVLRTALRRARD